MSTDGGRPMPIAWLAVVCTDKGQHKRARLCDVRWHPDYPNQWYVAEAGTHSPDCEDRSWEMWSIEGLPDSWMYDFHCQRCGRNIRVGRENWLRLMEAMHPRNWPDGVAQRDLDLSLLPF